MYCYIETLCLTLTHLNVMTPYTYLTVPLDILLIYSPSITMNLRNIFLIYIQQNFVDLNTKVNGSDIHTSVYDKRDDFGFPIVNFPGMSDDLSGLSSYCIYILQLVRFAKCFTCVLDFLSKNLQITSKLLTEGYRYHKLRKASGTFIRSSSALLSKFGDISLKGICEKESLIRASTVIWLTN